MKFKPSCSYEKINQRTFEEGIVTVWISTDVEDACWDAFLRDIPLGQFQQSTVWAQTKKAEGWHSLRVVFTLEDEITGGFQILERSSWWGKIGYVSKGPVILPNRSTLALYATEILQKIVRKEGLRALIVQPPDQCIQMSAKLAAAGFLHNILIGVIEATWIIDLRNGFETVEQNMKSETRRKVRQAAKRGLTIREGGKQDLSTFYDLMLSTCQRQGVEPSPSNNQSFISLWDASQQSGFIRLSLAEYKGKPIAGHININFGQNVTFYKKGWNKSGGIPNPTYLLQYEDLKWASLSGYQFCDFAAFDKKMAITMLRDEPKSDEQIRSRYEFLTNFGGNPRLLPESRVYFPNPIIRLAYSVIFYRKIQRAKQNRRLADEAIGLSSNI